MKIGRDELTALFQKLECETCESDDIVVGWFVVDGRRVLTLHFWKDDSSLSRQAVLRLRDQLCADDDELRDLIECPLSRDEYVLLLRDRGVLPDDSADG